MTDPVPAPVGPAVDRARHGWGPQPNPGFPEDLILFDGVCVLCVGWVRFVIERDRARRFRFTSIQSPFGRAMADRLGIDPEQPQTNAVVRGGQVYFKSDSALRVLAALPGWRPIGLLELMPRRLRDFLYDLVATNRYRLFGRHQSCVVPDADKAWLFIDRERQ